MALTRLCAAAVVIALTAWCSKPPTSPQAAQPLFGARGSTPFGHNVAAVDITNEPGTIFKVTYKPSTTIIDATTVRRATGRSCQSFSVFERIEAIAVL
jgi:hypothetical protein